MKQNKYDDNIFFEKYNNMERSKNGLEAAGEWHELRKLLPNFQNKRVLDNYLTLCLECWMNSVDQ